MNEVSFLLGFIPDWNWETWDKKLALFSSKYNYSSLAVTRCGHTSANTFPHEEKEILSKFVFLGPFFVGR